jgi:predicted peptidase
VQEQTTPEVFKNAAGETLNVRLYLPPALSAGRKWPVVLFLHGAGERGTNNVSQLKHGIESLIRYGKDANDPAILLVPQCPANEQWVKVPWNAPSHTIPEQPSRPLRLALALLREKMAALPVDPARVYVTGVSMGGYGTWDAVQREPRLFAAAMPICGGGDTALAPVIKHVPIWTFHGDKDTAVPVGRSRDMAKALEACGGKIQYREYPDAGHDVWTRTYNDTGVLTWFFSQRLPPPAN